MAQQKLPNVPSPSTTIYKTLLGVDFRSDQTETDRRRSPDMVNMISDMGGNPVKRYGYRRVASAYAGLVIANSSPYAVRPDSLDDIAVVPISIDDATGTITEDTDNAIYITESSFGEIRDVFGYQGYVFVICENGCIKADVIEKTYEITGIYDNMMSVGNLGSTAPVCESIVPLATIGLKPDATAGTSYYGKNLMSIYQEFRYQGDGTSTEFKIPLYSKMGNWAKVEIMDENGNWIEQTLGTDFTLGTASTETGVSLDGESSQSFEVVDAKVTFTTAPAQSTTLVGEDNVKIIVAPFNMADEMVISGVTCKKGYYNETFLKLLKSKAHMFFDGRLFFSVVEKTYYSEVNNPFSLPDNYWFDVDNEVIAYQRVNSYLVIITKDTGKNTIFLASAITDATTNTTQFQIKPSNAGVGAITGKVGGILNDEPIFLSSTGLYGILTNWNSEKYAVNRSGRINRRLCREDDLEEAVGVAFDGYYYLAVNGQMYILDGRHKDSTRSGETSYECYYFNNMPTIKQMFVADSRMYFTDELATYTWNDDLPPSVQYYDNLVLDEDGEYVSGDPVNAYWCSKYDDDGSPQILKTLNKKGTMVTLVPHTHSGCYVRLHKNGDEFIDLGRTTANIFTFEELNFNDEQFTFSTNAVAYDRFTKKKVKKYKRLQIMVGNDQAEPFGLTEVVKTYTFGNYAKR